MLKAQSVSVWVQAQTQEHPKPLSQHNLVQNHEPNTILAGDNGNLFNQVILPHPSDNKAK